MTPEVITVVERFELSPEQVSGWLKEQHGIGLSHERLYQHIWADKGGGGDLHKNKDRHVSTK